MMMGDYEQALTHYQQALDLRRSLKDKSGTAEILRQLGMIYQLRGQVAQAQAYYAEAQA